MDVTSVKTDQGLVFPVRLHNSFLLEEPRVLLGENFLLLVSSNELQRTMRASHSFFPIVCKTVLPWHQFLAVFMLWILFTLGVSNRCRRYWMSMQFTFHAAA